MTIRTILVGCLIAVLAGCTQQPAPALSFGSYMRAPAGSVEEEPPTGSGDELPSFKVAYRDGETFDFDISMRNSSGVPVTIVDLSNEKTGGMLRPVEFRLLLRDGTPVDFFEHLRLDPGQEVRVSVRALMTGCENYIPGSSSHASSIKYRYETPGRKARTATLEFPFQVGVGSPAPADCPRKAPKGQYSDQDAIYGS